MRALMWFRADLRVADNTALSEAARRADRGVVAVFLVTPGQWREHDWAAVKVDLILRTLEVLKADLADRGIPLLIETAERFDAAPEHLLDLARRHACDGLFFNREYERNEHLRDESVEAAFTAAGLEAHGFTDQVIVAPGVLRTGAGGFYTVFTPFRKSWVRHVGAEGPPPVLARPKKQAAPTVRASAIPKRVEGFDRAGTRPDLWPAGEHQAMKRLKRFAKQAIADYDDQRDLPAVDGTSALSPYLAIGAVSPRQCLAEAVAANGDRLESSAAGPTTWISELIWREFYRHILVGYPRVSMHRAFKRDTEAIVWNDDDALFDAWAAGRTGYPIVDAAMRQLLETGWMHNRLRMVTAMFFSKDLFLDWRRGERHFMRHLIDGDLASNNGGWQWSASTGTDAAPYFRIFNPTNQSRRFDPEGTFIRQYVPELERVKSKAIHDPSPDQREDADYPAPCVDHGKARDHAIAAFKGLKG